MSKRIYSNYSDADFEYVTNLARELGFSPSAFQHYCVMLYAGSNGKNSQPFPLRQLTQKMELTLLNDLNSGDTFIVSALIPEDWVKLSRSQKMILSKFLSRYVKDHPSDFAVYEVLSGGTNKYIKK